MRFVVQRVMSANVVVEGDKIGEMIVYTNGVETDEVDLLAFEKVDKATVWDSLHEITQEWNG